MDSLHSFYQSIPQSLDPIAFSIGFFGVRWYSLSYLGGFLIVFFLLNWRLRKGEKPQVYDLSRNKRRFTDTLFNLMIVAFIGIILGGRLGYVFFYEASFFWNNPWAVISPYDIHTGEYRGIYGMSYHGAFIGAVFFSYVYARFQKINYWKIVDFVVPTIAGGYFLGRIGNFLNEELVGRETSSFVGMYFNGENFLRHPAQLYEAFLEGIVLFLILWAIRNRTKFDGQLFIIYIVGYGFFRLIGEYFRAPEESSFLIWETFGTGQLLSLLMVIIGLILYFQKKPKNDIINEA